MNKLDIQRKKINLIDKKIVQLFEQRMNCVKEIAKYKIDNGIQIQDKNREKILLSKNLSYLLNEEYVDYYKIIFNSLLKVSKNMQAKLVKK